MKFIDNLKTAPLDKLVPLTPHLSFKTETSTSYKEPFTGRLVRSELRFTIDQIASENELKYSKGQVIEHFHERAKHAMKHELYSPIVQELHAIQILAWGSETPNNQEISIRIGKLIGEMS